MAVLTIPVRSDLPEYEFTIELEQRVYMLRFRLNSRLGRWLMDIAKTNGSTIVAGVPLISNVNLLARYQSADLPPGEFFVYDQTGKTESPGPDNLGTTVQLLYVEASTV